MPEKSHTLNWALGALAIVTLLTIAIIINNNHTGTTSEQIISGIATDNGDLKINWSRYDTYNVALSETYTITKSGIYHLTGTIPDGGIIIQTTSESVVKLIFDNVTIKNSTGPAIACYSADDLVIELVGENILEDGQTYAKNYDEDVNGVIYSKADLTLGGDGTLTLTANYQDGIVSKDDLKFDSGTFYVTAVDDAIRGKDSVYIVGGIFNLTARGDGIKSTNDTDSGKGFVLIENGEINLAVGDDGIHAERSLIINDGKINITKSYEGLEGRNILITGGDIQIAASDDGINAGGGSDTSNQAGAFASDVNCVLTIEGGDIHINASGDGVDSNGYIHFNGGNVVVDGPTNNGNGALDAGISINQTGGTVIAVGSSGMAETLGQNSNIYNVSVYFTSSQAAGTKITIKDSSGQTIIKHTAAKTFSHLAAGTQDFIIGETYTIYLNDLKYQSFTISNVTTVVGTSYSNPQNMMPGRR